MKIANFKGELGLFRISFMKETQLSCVLGHLVPKEPPLLSLAARSYKRQPKKDLRFHFPAGTASTTSPTEAPQVHTRRDLLLSSCPIKFSLGFKTPHSTKINCCLFWDLSFFNESYRKPFSQFKQVLRASPPIEVDRRISCFRWGRRKASQPN